MSRVLGVLAFIILFIIISFLLVVKIPKVSLASNQTNVTINVSALMEITILPSKVIWSPVLPASIGGLKYIIIKNTGSLNISSVYFYADTLTSEPNNPVGLSADKYSSGSVLVIRKNESGAKFYYVGRLEWNVSKPSNAGGTNCQNAIAWGYYRNVSGNYLWCLINGSEINATHGCNSTGTALFIESDIDDGNPNTEQPNIQAQVDSLSEADWGIFYFTSGPLADYCVATYRTCEKIFIYKYDKRSNPNFAACASKVEDLITTTITPGQERTVNLDVWVPQGMPYGWLASSWLTAEASS